MSMTERCRTSWLAVATVMLAAGLAWAEPVSPAGLDERPELEAAPTTMPAADPYVITRIESGGALETTMFYSFAAVALLSAIGVVVTRNIVRTATCLLFTLGAMAGFYFLLAANFVGAVQLIVYAGGTLVLIIFGVMLTGRTIANRLKAHWWELVLAVTACGVLLAGLVLVMTDVAWQEHGKPLEAGPTIDQVGTNLLTAYLVPFEVISVLLLVAMIGAAYLARPERRSS